MMTTDLAVPQRPCDHSGRYNFNRMTCNFTILLPRFGIDRKNKDPLVLDVSAPILKLIDQGCLLSLSAEVLHGLTDTICNWTPKQARNW